jgi:uridylate kinase
VAAFKRVLVKLSGQALAGTHGSGFDQGALAHIVDEVLAIQALGVQVAIMVGGGNIFRGKLAEAWSIERAEADNIGMMATVINSLMLRGALSAKGAGDVRVMTAMPITSIAEPYIRLRAVEHLQKGRLVIFAGGTGQPYVTTDYPAVQRALETRCDVVLAAKHGVDGTYTADPKVDSAARRFTSINFDEVLSRGLQVMEQSAFLLARDHGLPLHVFDFAEVGCMARICQGEAVGTLVAHGVPVAYA